MRTPSAFDLDVGRRRDPQRFEGDGLVVLIERVHRDHQVGAIGAELHGGQLTVADRRRQQLLGDAQGQQRTCRGDPGRQVGRQLDLDADLLAGRVELDLQRLPQRLGTRR